MLRFRRVCASVLVVFLCSVGSSIAGERKPDGPSMFGEEGPPLHRPYWRKNLFKRFGGDQKFLFTEWWPAEFRSYGFSVPLAVSVAAASRSSTGSGGIDLKLGRSVEEWTVGGRRRVAEGFSTLGDAETALVMVGSTYLVARWRGNDRLSRVASLSAEGLLNSALYSGVLKRISRRTRPSRGNVGEFFVQQPAPGQEPSSFPSGHATGAFTVAAIFAGEYREKRWVPWVAYGTAGLIAASRVQLGRHFPSDVLAGAVIGDSLGRMIRHRSGGDDRGRRPVWTRLRPQAVSGGGFGIEYRHAW